jgi:F-type H+-transporting ATPase subunit epsilon
MAASAHALQVSLVSADAEVWTGEASLVVAKTVEGEIGFMTGHEPVLAILAEGQVRITQTDGTKVLANAQDGFLSMEGDVLTIVAGNAALIA